MFGPTTIVAAHADDETLSCGGLIALLRCNGQPSSIVVVADSGSAQRRTEIVTSVNELGVASRDVQFLGYRDDSLAEQAINHFEDVVKRMHAVLEPLAPATLIIPFRGGAAP
jgi:LmbE family N-acetylglucosaminyl deacetylase